MRFSTRPLYALAVIVLPILFGAASTRMSSQSKSNGARIPTLVGLGENSSDAPVLMRFAGAREPDAIVVGPRTTPHQLAIAALQMSRIRKERGDVAKADELYRVRSMPSDAAKTRGREERMSLRILASLSSAPRHSVTGFGRRR